MSEHDGTDDPYRTPGPRSGEPGSPQDRSYGQQPSPQQPYGQPYPQQPYPQSYPQQPYPAPAWGGETSPAGTGPGGVPKPPSVVRLVQLMLAGAVAALLQGVYAAFVVDDLVAESRAEIGQVAADTGLDAARFADFMTTAFLVVLAVSTLVSVGLWLLFARLFDRGSGRVVGTVLGALNGATLLFGLLQPADVIEWVLTAVSAAIVVAALVLLWRPATSAYFGAVAASRRTGWA